MPFSKAVAPTAVSCPLPLPVAVFVPQLLAKLVVAGLDTFTFDYVQLRLVFLGQVIESPSCLSVGRTLWL